MRTKLMLTLSLAFLVIFTCVDAQTLTFPLNNGFSATVSGAGPTICQQPSAAASAGSVLYTFATVNPAYLNGLYTGINLYSNDEAGYHIAQAGGTKQITIDIPNFATLGLNGTIQYNYGQFDDNLFASDSISTGQIIPPTTGGAFSTIRHVINITFPLGIRKGYFAFKVVDGDISSPYPPHMCVIPFVVEGPTVAQVPPLGTTVQPQMPYMVLHVPPGDGSSSSFVKNKTTCREIVDTYAEDNSNSANLAVKLGVAGQAGFIVTTKFEFSVTFSGSLSAGDMVIETKGNQTCITTNKSFQTTKLGNLEGSGDVFIGYGTDLAYGVYPYLKVEGCAVKMDTGLIYLPVGVPREFALTKTEISALITKLEATVADSMNVDAKTANDAQNQIDVWNQVLAMNDANVNNPNNDLLGNVQFGSGSSETVDTTITVTQTNSIEYEQYLEGTFGVEAVIEVAGSGVTGGYEYKSAKRYGATQSQTVESSKMVEYTLADKDDGDLFNLDIVRDPMFGTPIFRIKPGTKSSCPYQGGYQRDQPQVKHVGTANDHITIFGAPVSLDSAAIFQIQVCNNNPDESRTYLLSLVDNSNPGGARVLASGFELNTPRTYDIAANSCKTITIEVKRVSNNSTLAYPNLELALYPECEPGISSSIFASVYFGNTTSVDNATKNISQLAVYPNPASNVVNVAFDLKQAAPTRFELIDLLGSTRYAEDMDLPSGANQHRLDTSNLPNGIYILKMQCGSAQLSKKLVIEK